MRLKSGSLEERIIRALEDMYPITVSDLTKILHIKRERVMITLRKLQKLGIVELDILPDKIYVRLIKRVGFVGIDQKQKRALKHKDRHKPKDMSDDEVDYIL